MRDDHADLFVGSVAVSIGVALIAAAATNSSWFYSLRSARFLESRLTRTGARVVHTLLGLGLVALGTALLAGFRWQLWAA